VGRPFVPYFSCFGRCRGRGEREKEEEGGAGVLRERGRFLPFLEGGGGREGGGLLVRSFFVCLLYFIRGEGEEVFGSHSIGIALGWGFFLSGRTPAREKQGG